MVNMLKVHVVDINAMANIKIMHDAIINFLDSGENNVNFEDNVNFLANVMMLKPRNVVKKTTWTSMGIKNNKNDNISKILYTYFSLRFPSFYILLASCPTANSGSGSARGGAQAP